MNTLRRSFLLLFCLRLLVSGEVITEIFKLPFLIGHYLHHHHTEGHSHVFGFLMEHYGSHDHHDQDATDHQAHHKLPFGDHHRDGFKEQIQPFLTITGLNYPRIKVPAIPDSPLICPIKQWHSQFSPSIWQPPKIGWFAAILFHLEATIRF